MITFANFPYLVGVLSKDESTVFLTHNSSWSHVLLITVTVFFYKLVLEWIGKI